MSKIDIMKKSIIEIINNNDLMESYVEETIEGKIVMRLEFKTKITMPCKPTISGLYPLEKWNENE